MSLIVSLPPNLVMPGLVPGIHDIGSRDVSHARSMWMAGTSPAMTISKNKTN
jgi:hypothetical protein